MLTLYVDGDACPVKDEVVKVAARYQLSVYMVSNQSMRPSREPNVHKVTVGAGFDAADDWIADKCETDDIVITADIPLAARCLQKGAHALNPDGRPFTAENIGAALATRSLNQYLREAGEIKGHNPSFSKQHRSQFLQALDTLIQKIKRATG